jgi:hypothetical protein
MFLGMTKFEWKWLIITTLIVGAISYTTYAIYY